MRAEFYFCVLFCAGIVCAGCPRGYYGNNCQHECHCYHGPCNVSGVCSPPDCEDGWTGARCNQKYTQLISTYNTKHHTGNAIFENLIDFGIQLPSVESLTFNIKTFGSAYMLLSESSSIDSHIRYHIGIGVLNNRTAVNLIKFSTRKIHDRQESYASKSVLDGNEFRKVYLSWKNGIINIIVDCRINFTYVDQLPFPVLGIGIRSTPEATWRFDLTGRDRRTYNPLCEKDCGHCRLNASCHRLTGECPHGCDDGWKGNRCDVQTTIAYPWSQNNSTPTADTPTSTGLFSSFAVTPTESADFGLFNLNITNTNVGFGASICPVFDTGDNITCYASFGDSLDTGTIWLEPDYLNYVCTGHNYTTAGYKNITVYCVDTGIFKYATGSFYIGTEIKDLNVVDTNNNIFIPITRSETSTIRVTYTEGSHVYINATTQNETALSTILYESYNGSMELTQTFDIAGSNFLTTGQYAVHVSVFNELTKLGRDLVFAVADRIEGYVGYWNISSTNFVHVGEVIVFSITTTAGSDIIYSTEIGSTAYIEVTSGHEPSYEFFYTFPENGTFEITLSASNYVSQLENSTSITVQYRVNNVSVSAPLFNTFPNVYFTYAMEVDALLPMGTLQFELYYDGNLAGPAAPFTETPGTTTTNPVSFPSQGSFMVLATVFSESSEMNFTFPVVVEKTIQNLEFLYPTTTKISDPNTLGVRLTNNADGPILNVTCVYTITIDAVTVTFTEVFNLTDVNTNSTTDISYPDTGVNQVTVNCSNQISWQSLTGTVNVTSDCFEIGTLFSTSYKDEISPLSMMITNDNTITGKGVVTLTCRNSSRDYFWELWPRLENGTYVKDTYYSNPANQPKSATIFFGKETINEGFYKLRLVVNLTDLAQFLEDDMYIEFRLPPIVTGIDGGTTRYVNSAENILFNAAPKTEDKVIKYQNVPFSYTWTCRQGLTQAQIDQALGEFGTAAATDINTFGSPCVGVPTTGESFTLASGSLSVNTWYLFKLHTEKITTSNILNIETVSTNRTAEALQAVYVQSGNAPRSEILCKRNCLPKLSRNSMLILNADCPDCDSTSTSYEWTIYLYNSATKLFENIDTIPAIDQSRLLETTLSAEEIGVKVDALNEGDTVKFRVIVRTPGRSQSTAEYVATVNAPPYGGTCSVTPPIGEASTTWFTVSCANWKDEGTRYERNPPDDLNEVITYSVYQQRNTTDGYVLTNLLSESGDTSIVSTLSVGDPNNAFASFIKVLIRDFYNGYVELYLPVTVNNPINTDRSTQSDVDIISNITTLIANDMAEALSSNDPKQVLHQASVLVASITLIPVTTETFNTTDDPLAWYYGILEADANGTRPYDDILNDLLKRDEDAVKIAIIEAIDNLTRTMEEQLGSNATTFYMIEMASNSFANVLDDNTFISTDAGTSASNALILLVSNFENVSETALTADKLFDSSDPRLESTADAIVGLISAVVGATLTSDFPTNGLALISTNTADAREQVEYMAKVYGDEAYALMESGEMTPEERNGLYLMRARISQAEFKERQDLASITTTSVDHAIQIIIDQVLNMTCKGCNTTFDKQNIDILMTKTTLQLLNEMANQLLNNTDSAIEIVLARSTDSNDTTLFGIAVFDQNLYIPGDEDTALITSDVHKLSLKDETETNIVQTRVAINQTVPLQFQQTTQTLPYYTEGDASKLFYHSSYIRDDGDYVCVSVQEEIPNIVTSYDVYVKGDAQPTHLDYDAKGELSPYNDWMMCFPPQLFDGSGEIHVALHANSKTSNFPDNYEWSPTSGRYANGSTYNITEPELVPYNFTIVTSNCKEWDPKNQRWDSSNCKMDWFPSKGIIECTCAPSFGLTFGNTFFVAPNTIDFSTVFLKFDLANQAAVLGTLIAIFVIYLLLLIWARHQDKKDIVKWGVTPLIDNFVDDTYYYLVTVYTGLRRGAGTKSRIGFIVCGEDGDTGIRELSDGVRQEIPTASVVHFLMSTPYPLGDLSYVYIWHDNSGEGESSSWYLNRVDVEDIQKKERFVFLCGKWLCLDSVDSSVDAVLPVCGKENVTTFSNMFYINTKENLADNHMWIAIFFRPTSSHYTRCQRLTCFLLFIFLTMIGNAIYFRPEDEYTNAGSDIRVGPFAFSLRAIYIAFICALISTPTTILVIMLFKKSKPKKNVSYNVKGDKSKKYRVPVIDTWMDKLMADSRELEKALVAKGLFNTDGTIFPYWFQWIAWLLALSGIGTCSFFILLYSIEWGKKKSEVWLGQFFLSFFSSTCVLDPMKVLLMSAIFAMLLKQTNRFRPTGLERSFILKNYKQRFGYETGIRLPAPPLDHLSLKKARLERAKELKMTQSIKQVVLTGFCLWIIYSISYSNRDNRSFNFHRNIATKLLTPQDKTLTKFHSITRVEDYVKWLRDTAFPVLYPDADYRGERLHWRLRQYFHDMTSFRVGPPRLRQMRVKESSEDFPYFGEVKVAPKYTIYGEETRDFCFRWKLAKCDYEDEARSFSYAGWKFTSALDVWGVPIPGRYKTYGGGGYITELDVNLDFSNRTLNELTDYLWIDKKTRAIFLEFNLYTPDLNLFAYNNFLAEFPETGGIITMYSIYPFRIYHHLGTSGIYTLFCEIMFVILLFCLIIKVAYGIYKQKKFFFKDVWNVMDCSIISMSLVSVAMYTGRYLLAAQTMAKFKEDSKQFIDFQHIALWDFLFNLLLATLVFMATLRLVGIMGYDKRVGQVIRVFENCARDLFWFGVFFFYVFLCYAALGYLLFGKDIESYSDIFESLGTLFISMIGKSKFTEINDKDPIMAQFYFFTFILLLVYTLLTMFLAILGESINAIHNETKRSREEELVEYLMNKFKNLFVRKSDSAKKQNKQNANALQNKPVGFLYDLRKGINDAFDQYSDDGKPLPPAIIDLEKRAKMVSDSNKQAS